MHHDTCETFPAGGGSSAAAPAADEDALRVALLELITQEYGNLFGRIRVRGFDHHDAEDALHDFVAKLIRLEVWQKVRSRPETARAYVSAALEHFLINWRRDRQRRVPLVSLEAEQEHEETWGRLTAQFATDDCPARILDRKQSEQMIGRALVRVEDEYSRRGKGNLFNTLRPVLADGGSLKGHDQNRLASAVAMSEGTLRVALSRMLKDCGVAMREELQRCDSDADEIGSEINHLLGVFQTS